ncbi:MAG: ABC transporter permease [Oscillospiraceae bacterium]|nr:ABC transporter permease [Oscillospiraceae bacterium]
MLESFEMELRQKGLPENYAVISEASTFENVAGHLENLQNLTRTFLIIVLVLGAFIMALLSVISIRERKYEIGVLRAMGMKKKTVALGIWIEILAITCVCFVLGMGAGSLLSQPVSDVILAGQTDAINVHVSVSARTAMQILGVSVLLASIAGMISISRITQCEPIKILMERN